MMDGHKERWMDLCERASVEQDTAKLIELAEQIIRLLEEKDVRLKERKSFSGMSVEGGQLPLPSERDRTES
jgi:hypothetical protein